MTTCAAAGCTLLLRLCLLSLLAAALTAIPSTCSALTLAPPSTFIVTISSTGAAVTCTVQLRALLSAPSYIPAATVTPWQPVWESGSIAPPAAVIYSVADAHTHCRHQAFLRCTVGAGLVTSAVCVYPRHGYFFSPLVQPLSSPLHFHVTAYGDSDGSSCLWSAESERDVEGFSLLQDAQRDSQQHQPVCPVLSNRSRVLSAAHVQREHSGLAGRRAALRESRLHDSKLHRPAARTVRWLLLLCLLSVLHALVVLRLMHSCTARIEAVRAL
jgi:hypothetical protein